MDIQETAAGPAGWRQVLVALDVDAPVGALAGAQHAGRAVLLVEGDDAACPGGGRLLDPRVLDGVGALREGAHHRPHGDAEALQQAGELEVGSWHQTSTFSTPVTTMLTSDSGIRTFQASVWSWSSRNRG